MEDVSGMMEDVYRFCKESFKQIIAGSCGGILLVFAGHPMDTIKTRMQINNPKHPLYSSTLDCVKKIYRKEGVRGFYSGLQAPLILVTPVNAVIFSSYALSLAIFKCDPQEVDKCSYVTVCNAGILSGFVTAIVNCPAERIKCLLQVPDCKYKGFMDCTRKIYQAGGIQSIFRGMIPTFLREMPGSGMYFVVYEMLRRNSADWFGLQCESMATLLAGGMAGVLFWATGIPGDVVKSIVQTMPEEKVITSRGLTRRIAKKIYLREGLRGFFKGAAPVFLRAFPSNAAAFFGYVYTMKLFNEMNWDGDDFDWENSQYFEEID